jgi:LysM repeat protein
MANRLLTPLVIGMLLLGSVSVACTRARPEPLAPTETAGTSVPTVTVAAVQTGIPSTPSSATSIVAATSGPQTPGPTTISVTPPAGPDSAELTPAIPSPTAPPQPERFEYTVQWGDTLSSIAYRFGTTVEQLMAVNGLTDPSYIRVGQVIWVSGELGSGVGSSGEYVVQAGDTLYSVALRFGTTVEAIQQANGLWSGSYIQIGQRLVIPPSLIGPGPSGGQIYVIQAGDTLYGIALRYGLAVADLAAANDLVEPYLIYVGQALIIP